MDDGAQSDGSTSLEAHIDTSTSSQQQPTPVVLCSYGQRLGFAYFGTSPAPDASVLNRNDHGMHFFTIDNALVYLS